MRRDIQPDEEAERLARLRGENGYTAFKFRIGKECGHDQDEWPGRTEAIVAAMREALGDGAVLMVDALARGRGAGGQQRAAVTTAW